MCEPSNFFWLYRIIQHPFSSTDNAHDRCTTGVQHLVRRLINTSHWVYIFWCAGTVWRCDDWRQQHLQRCWDPAGVVESPWLPSLILLKSVTSACYIAHCCSARLQCSHSLMSVYIAQLSSVAGFNCERQKENKQEKSNSFAGFLVNICSSLSYLLSGSFLAGSVL